MDFERNKQVEGEGLRGLAVYLGTLRKMEHLRVNLKGTQVAVDVVEEVREGLGFVPRLEILC
jgi:hypothetical protein